ncbi:MULTISPECIES: 5-formyltetrahydrofolate cyclo-ligase [Corallincola]|uniref:5-formyltetrahydrofolate cyclo-ligase n=2 Tax=Corallincola TaxID=1775176 RepID=A0ABY1WLW3_9GAMM|nr:MULTISPECIES: 5-formyltetrahydrofolate cyclo-ligase [Corallincola]TAA41792.1 5-formyltetrahydrofolate cyclo-ligase [Corallincola spongiicola]TCI02217.1 5-formyltetrahydrofolate cyclo-ligase [Corallincola luteus]
MNSSRQQIRQQIRLRRQQLSDSEQRLAAESLLSQLQSFQPFVDAQRVGLYLANDGEIDPDPIIQWLWQQQRQVYLPLLHPFCKGHLLFLQYQHDTLLIRNRFGIPEPSLDVTQISPLNELDIILCPLVAFDADGNRLGMGGGFYDRTLSRWQTNANNKPLPVGLAHDCQHVDSLPHQHWDVPLPTIITPSKQWQWTIKSI